ncbi:Nif3-like dinuclear metal center hexameric protein [Bifidobacterium psychraerophilum]|uniref:Nif3-like dinuclear metal center hexameric protein n=1 Tax=Bifidobacterium psychraerophilum TaxID=218140 RepID=UPI0039E9B822
MADALRLEQVIGVLQELYPLRYAEDWDAPGLIVGDLCAPVHAIHCAVDPTPQVVDEAIEQGADLLVTHHPLLFRSVHEVSGLGFRGEIIRRLIEHHCALWVGHTNADAAYRGVAEGAAEAFGLQDLSPLLPIDDELSEHQVGLGRVGVLPQAMSLRDFAMRVKDALPFTQAGVQVSGDLEAPVSRVAVLPGSGDSMFDDVRACGADVFVTSDLRHHPALDAIEQARYEAAMRGAGVALGSGDGHIRPALINTPHSAIESLWFRHAGIDIPARVQERYGVRPQLTISALNTDPWSLRI